MHLAVCNLPKPHEPPYFPIRLEDFYSEEIRSSTTEIRIYLPHNDFYAMRTIHRFVFIHLVPQIVEERLSTLCPWLIGRCSLHLTHHHVAVLRLSAHLQGESLSVRVYYIDCCGTYRTCNARRPRHCSVNARRGVQPYREVPYVV